MARSRRRGSTVLPLNTSRSTSSRSMGQPSQRTALASQRSAPLEGDLGAALAPQTSVLGSGPLATLTPNIQSYAPEGGADAGQGTQLIDALANEPGPPIEAAPAATMGGPADTFGGPYGGPSGSPESDQALMNAESTYGTPGAETPLSLATQSSMLGSSPGASLADIVPGYQAGGQPAMSLGDRYNQNKLLRILMEEGY